MCCSKLLIFFLVFLNSMIHICFLHYIRKFRKRLLIFRKVFECVFINFRKALENLQFNFQLKILSCSKIYDTHEVFVNIRKFLKLFLIFREISECLTRFLFLFDTYLESLEQLHSFRKFFQLNIFSCSKTLQLVSIQKFRNYFQIFFKILINLEMHLKNFQYYQFFNIFQMVFFSIQTLLHS